MEDGRWITKNGHRIYIRTKGTSKNGEAPKEIKSPVVNNAPDEIIDYLYEETGRDTVSKIEIDDYINNDFLDDELSDYQPTKDEYEQVYKELQKRGYKVDDEEARNKRQQEFTEKANKVNKETKEKAVKAEETTDEDKRFNTKEESKRELDDNNYHLDKDLRKKDYEHDLKWFEDMEKQYPSKEGLANNEEYQALKQDYESEFGEYKSSGNTDSDYETYKKAKENPDSIDPMTEWSTDWEALEEKYKDRYEKEKSANKTDDLMTASQLKGKDREEQKEINKQYLKEQNKLAEEKNSNEDNISKKQFNEASKIDDPLDRAIQMQVADDVGKTLTDDDIRFRAENYIKNNYNGNASDDEIYEKLKSAYKNNGSYQETNNDSRSFGDKFMQKAKNLDDRDKGKISEEEYFNRNAEIEGQDPEKEKERVKGNLDRLGVERPEFLQEKQAKGNKNIVDEVNESNREYAKKKAEEYRNTKDPMFQDVKEERARDYEKQATGNNNDEDAFKMYNSQYDKEVTVKKGADGKWVDSDGNKYMGYLSKEDVKKYFKGGWKETKETRNADEIISDQMSKTAKAQDETAKALGIKRDTENGWKTIAQLYKEQKGKDLVETAVNSKDASKYNDFVQKNSRYDDKNFSDRKAIDEYAKANNLDADSLYYMTKIASESDKQKLKKATETKGNGDWVRDAFNKYKKEHPGTKLTFANFKKNNLK